jgi:hypothetical protein
MDLVSIETPSVRVTASAQTLEFRDALFRIVSYPLLQLSGVSTHHLGEIVDLLKDKLNNIDEEHVCLHRLLYVTLNYSQIRPRHRKPNLLHVGLFGRSGTLRLQGLDDRVGKFRGAGTAADIPSKFAAIAIDLVDGVANLPSGVVLAEMAEHEQG